MASEMRDEELTKEEIVEKLKKRVDEIREKASKDHTDDEIAKQFMQIFNGYDWEKKVDEQTKPSLLKLAWNIMKLILIIATALVLVIIASYIAATQNPYLGKKIRNMMHDRNIAYIVARYMRKISLPLHNIVDLKRAQKWECLVQNPFYKSEEPNCEMCEIPLEIFSVHSFSKEAKSIAQAGEPCVIVDEPEFMKYNYNYTFLKDFYQNNKEELDFSVCEVYGDRGNQKLENFFKNSEEDIIKSKQSFGWKNCRIEGTRVLRKLFRRPSFVPVMSEIYLEKHLFIIHKDSPSKLTLPPCGTSNCFIAQVYGSSQITLTPFDGCLKNCTESEQADLKTGEIFYYPDQPWKVALEATNGDLSIIYRSDFS